MEPLCHHVRHHLLRLIVQERIVRHLNGDLSPALKDEVATTEGLPQGHDGFEENRNVLGLEEEALEQGVVMGVDVHDIHRGIAPQPVTSALLDQDQMSLVRPVDVTQRRDGVTEEGQTLLALTRTTTIGITISGALTGGQLPGLRKIEEAQQIPPVVGSVSLHLSEDHTRLVAWNGLHVATYENGHEVRAAQSDRVNVALSPDVARE